VFLKLSGKNLAGLIARLEMHGVDEELD